MAIAIFGGSFDPPHNGHVAVVQQALRVLPIDSLYVVPAYVNPFKSGTHAPPELRMHWLENIFADDAHVHVSDFEIRHMRPVPTIETVRHFKQADTAIYLVIGADHLQRLCTWHDFETLDRMVTWVVASRRGFDSDVSAMLHLDVHVDISSTRLRGLEETDLLPETVRTEIINFYKEKMCKND